MSLIQNLTEGDIDIQAFSLFFNADAATEVPRRLNLPVQSLSHYEQYLEALKSVYTQTTGMVTVNGVAVKPVTVAVRDAIDAAILGDYKTQLEQQIASMSGGRKSYKTYAEMLAKKSEIAANSIIDITNDTTANNGAYNYDGTTFTKSAYDPLTQSKSYTDTAKSEAISAAATDATTKADAVHNFAESALADKADKTKKSLYTDFVQGYVTPAGDEVVNTTRARSRVYKLSEGTVITLNRLNSEYVFGYKTGATDKLGHDGGQWFDLASTTTLTITADNPYIRFFIRKKSSTDITVTEALAGVEIYTPVTLLYSDSALTYDDTKKADAIKQVDYNTLELGYVNLAGDDIASTTQARSPVYKFAAGTVLALSRKDNSHIYGYNTSATEKVGHEGGLWIGTGAAATQYITITADKPYIRFFVRNSTITTLDLAAAKATVNMSKKTTVAYIDDVDAKLSTLTTKMSSLGMMEFNSLYRTPSRATGGVISFIDDDGRDGVLSTLQPFYKSNGVPFAAAIVPKWIGTTGFLTLEQLRNLAISTDDFEVMSHTFGHGNLVNLTTVAQKEAQVYQSKQWFVENNFAVNGFVLPYGADDATVRRIVQKYYPACYDFDGSPKAETFATIKNSLINRTNWDIKVNRLDTHKALIDQAAANNGWVVITTHVNTLDYWNSTSQADLQALIDYAKLKGITFMLPRDGFQTFGNIVDNDSGFKIQANGVIATGT